MAVCLKNRCAGKLVDNQNEQYRITLLSPDNLSEAALGARDHVEQAAVAKDKQDVIGHQSRISTS